MRSGFYVLHPRQEDQLILGPFQGKVACQTIAYGKGVCGSAAASGQTQLVPDVEKYPGHIACDSLSASEIVVPIVVLGKVRSLTLRCKFVILNIWVFCSVLPSSIGID